EGYYRCTMEGLVLEHNQAFNRILGFDISQDQEGAKLPDFWQDPSDRKEYLNELMTNGFIRNYQINAKTNKGKKIVIMANSHIIKDEKGLPVRIEGTFIDITGLREAEAEIHRLNESLEQRVRERTAELEAANKELEAFSYSVSHDLRAPLRAIDGFSRILFDEFSKKLDQEGIRLLNVIRSSTQNMGRLIEDLLLFSKLSRQEMNFTMIGMEKLVRSAWDDVLPESGTNPPRLELKSLLDIYGDKPMMHQVLVNLFSNAVKFSCKKNTRVIEVGSSGTEREIIYYVKDNGVGFDMAYSDKLFGVFQRLHSSSEFEGTGIGLAIVKRVVLKHGGRVWAEGKAGEGAVFYFALPVHKSG
ncbi:MAG: ATP-binding protein, partial [bacterium]|nr:ATP-binding protein [bacterium]